MGDARPFRRRRLGSLRRFGRGLLAWYFYLRRPILEFLPTLTLLVVAILGGGYAFHTLHPRKPGFAEGTFHTYCLMFGEHLMQDFPDHWLLRAFYVLMPMLGLVVFFDGIVRFVYHVLRKDQTGKEWLSAVTRSMSDHVILCGLGNLGVRVMQELLRQGEEVAVLEKNPQAPHLAVARRAGVPVLIGNGREEGILDDLNVKTARSIILATSDDLANLEMALDARKVNPEIRVVLRMFDQELASKVRDSIGISLAFSASALAAPVFAISSAQKGVVNSFPVGERNMVVVRRTIKPAGRLIGKSVGALRKSPGTYVLELLRGSGERVYHPADDVALAEGDTLTIQTEQARLADVNEVI
jgi:Trk K+ transport system NAD-binding subunit